MQGTAPPGCVGPGVAGCPRGGPNVSPTPSPPRDPFPPCDSARRLPGLAPSAAAHAGSERSLATLRRRHGNGTGTGTSPRYGTRLPWPPPGLPPRPSPRNAAPDPAPDPGAGGGRGCARPPPRPGMCRAQHGQASRLPRAAPTADPGVGVVGDPPTSPVGTPRGSQPPTGLRCLSSVPVPPLAQRREGPRSLPAPRPIPNPGLLEKPRAEQTGI